MTQAGCPAGPEEPAAASPEPQPQCGPVEIDSSSRDQLPRINEYLWAMIRYGPASFIDNAPVEMKALLIDGKVIPFVISEPGPNKADVCSAHSHYALYTLWELRRRHTFLLHPVFHLLLRSFGMILRLCRIDKVIYINDWLLVTNPVEPLSRDQLKRITDFLVRKYPKHAIVHRSVNPALNYRHCRDLMKAGFALVKRRIVYLADTRGSLVRRSSHLKRDFSLLKSTPYTISGSEDLRPADPARISEIYRSLYLEKYCPLNPHYNERFFALAMRDPFFIFRLFRRDGRIDAFTFYFSNDGHMTGLVLGHDQKIPRKAGLYRMISAWKIPEAEKKGQVVNLSGGVGQYKCNRGAVPSPEYDAVYDRHLPFRRRLAWFLVRLAGAWRGNWRFSRKG